MNRIAGLVRLMRPVNVVICGLSVIAGGSLGGKPLTELAGLATIIFSRGLWNLEPWQWRTILAALSASLILAAGNVLNDVCDVSCDRINAPDRPIPAGRVSRVTAAVFAACLAAAGILTAIPLGPAGISVAAVATILLAWYDLRLKRVPLAGNVTVATLGGLAFLYGGIAGYAPLRSLLPAIFAFLYHLGRELIKDAADYPGDTAADIRTVATVRGIPAAGRTAAVVLGVLAVATLMPLAAGLFGWAYGAVTAVLVLPPVCWCIAGSIRATSPVQFSRFSAVLKAGMPAGILAVLVGFQMA